MVVYRLPPSTYKVKKPVSDENLEHLDSLFRKTVSVHRFDGTKKNKYFINT